MSEERSPGRGREAGKLRRVAAGGALGGKGIPSRVEDAVLSGEDSPFPQSCREEVTLGAGGGAFLDTGLEAEGSGLKHSRFPSSFDPRPTFRHLLYVASSFPCLSNLGSASFSLKSQRMNGFGLSAMRSLS